MKSVAALVALVALAGCSFIGVHGPPSQRPADGEIHCSDAYVLPIIDGAFAGIWGASLIGAMTLSGGPFKESVVLMAAFGTLPYAISAAVGAVDVSRCRTAKREMAQAPVPSRDADRTEARAQAWELTKAASSAARSGDCVIVIKLGADVRSIDADFHDSVFVRDAAIARCLAANAAPPGP